LADCKPLPRHLIPLNSYNFPYPAVVKVQLKIPDPDRH